MNNEIASMSGWGIENVDSSKVNGKFLPGLDESVLKTGDAPLGLPNGHNEDIVPRGKSLGELLEESEELPDTEIISCTEAANKEENHNVEKDLTDEDEKKPDEAKEDIDSSNQPDMTKMDGEVKKSDDEAEKAQNDTDADDDDSMEREVPKPLTELTESSKEEAKTDASDVKKEEETKEVVNEVNDEEMEVSNEKQVEDEACACKPSCHWRIGKVSELLEATKIHLENYINLNKKDKSELVNLVPVFGDIVAFAKNEPTPPLNNIAEPFYEETPGGKKKKSKQSGVKIVETPKKETAERKSKEIKEVEFVPLSEASFKSLDGLAVFAKWPNSGWYYPGIIEGLESATDWKEETNVTVKFYDGLVREMKNTNILPAHLIPANCVVCDLDDETEMTVVSSKSSTENKVEFTLSAKDKANTFDLGFNKLAFRAAHMKIIKQQLKPTTEVSTKKMHMVSLDNLVSGRRMRGRLSKEDGEESNTESTTPRKTTRKSVKKTDEQEEQPAEAPATTPTRGSKRRSSSEKLGSTSKRLRQ